ncbi:SpoIIE family protein phosphatase [Streptomyces sp. NPDC002092]
MWSTLPPGPPLGLGGLPFEAAEVDRSEGSLLALHNDGLIEARDRDIETGLTRRRHALARPSASLEAACVSALRALLPTGRPDDDVALLLARTRALGEHQVAAWDVDADPSAVARARSSAARQLTAWGHLRRARAFDEGGRSHLLVAQLAERWDTARRVHGVGLSLWAP